MNSPPVAGPVGKRPPERWLRSPPARSRRAATPMARDVIRYAGGAELVPASIPAQGGGDELELRSLWRALWRRKLLVSATVLAVTGAAVAYVQLATPLYRAQTLVRIEPSKPLVVDLPDVAQGFELDDSSIESEIELLRSQAFAERMVERLGLANDPEFNPALRPTPSGLSAKVADVVSRLPAPLGRLVGRFVPGVATDAAASTSARGRIVDRFEASLSVEQVSKSYVLDIRFMAESPETAARIANAVAEAYIGDQLERKLLTTERAREWLQQRVAEMRDRLVDTETRIVSLQAEKGIVSADRVDPLAQQIGQLNTQLADARAARAEAEARYGQIAQLVRSKAGIGAAVKVMNSPLMAELRAQETEAQRNLSELATQFGDRHPQMLNAQAQLKTIRARMTEEAQRYVQDLENEVAVARARERELRASLDAIEDQVQGQERSSVELRDVEREAASARTIYEAFLNRLREVSEAHELQQPDAVLLSRAEVPLDPAFPNKLLIVLVAAGASVMLGVVLAFAVEQWGNGHGLRSAEEIESALGERTLALLPALGRRELQGHPAEDYVLRRPQSAFSEAVQRIRTSLFLDASAEPVKVSLVTSTLPGEGKSLLCASLARQSARSGLRTLVIDADMRRPRLHQVMRCDNRDGLGDVLNGTVRLDDAVRTDASCGLDFLVAGTPSSSPPDLFRSAALRQLIATVRDGYDLVLIDSPPVGAVSDSLILAPQVDRTVFVVRWDVTPRRMAAATLRQLAATGARIAGVALSRVDVRKHARYNYADSGYYAGAYRKYYVN
ncbi:MAG: polysaccharide biosynthesis tyrosine autokinase [Geminicoccaceae bacterium]